MGNSVNDRKERERELRAARLREEEAKRRAQNKIVYTVLGCLVGVVLLGAVIGLLLTRPGKGAPTMEDIDLSDLSDVSALTETEEVTDLVKMTVQYTTSGGETKTGDIYLRLFPEVAPKSVANFQKLVGNGSYDGMLFHRVYPGFMIQGGANYENGNLSTAANIAGEFSANGFENNLSHVRGVLSMARATEYNSASSSFFIMHADGTNLDGQYAAFGYACYGMDVVDAITQIELTSTASSIDSVNTTPVEPVVILKAVFVK